jgi:hypothetical protein
VPHLVNNFRVYLAKRIPKNCVLFNFGHAFFNVQFRIPIHNVLRFEVFPPFTVVA